jgi:anhydro-N-acetylmuramic acid kinase
MNLASLLKKKEKRIVGLMSGTSADSIDAVLLTVRGAGHRMRFRVEAFVTHRYPAGYRAHLLSNSLPGSSSVDELCRLNMLAAHFFADAVRAVARKAGIAVTTIDAIGSHGQTVHHLPELTKRFGKSFRSTLQIGDPSAIAKLTGILTVGNFRAGDVALGGQGAPLVPYFDYMAFRSSQKNRLLLNIGGIANITLLPKDCTAEDVLAFDTGPGNMLIDALTMKLFGRQFDRRGAIARRGNILPGILSFALRLPYFQKKPPKSTGREQFGAAFAKKILALGKGAHPEDIIASVTELTPLTVFHQYAKFLRKICTVDELIVSGGGARNDSIMEALRHYFAPAAVIQSDEAGVSSEAKEAICFALLANETLAGNPANLPRVTGASRATVLGSINLP